MTENVAIYNGIVLTNFHVKWMAGIEEHKEQYINNSQLHICNMF